MLDQQLLYNSYIFQYKLWQITTLSTDWSLWLLTWICRCNYCAYFCLRFLWSCSSLTLCTLSVTFWWLFLTIWSRFALESSSQTWTGTSCMPLCSSERTIAQLDWAVILANDGWGCTPSTQLSNQNSTLGSVWVAFGLFFFKNTFNYNYTTSCGYENVWPNAHWEKNIYASAPLYFQILFALSVSMLSF